MPNNQKSKDLQKAFAAHIRNPDRYPKPKGINDQRMQVYRDLFFNNISNLIKQTFPILASLHHADEWSQLIRSFYQSEHNKTPYFTEISAEFVQFLKTYPEDKKRPFMAELAHYEWLELSVEKNQKQPVFSDIEPSKLLSQRPVISPWVNAHSYHYPVHQIGVDYQPRTYQEDSHLMVWRDRHDAVHFAQLNTGSYALLKQLQQGDKTGHEAILSIFNQDSALTEDKIIEFGQQQLLKWVQQDIITETSI